ncbi:MAG: FHA domain-containing protein [Rhodobacter sp.]|nr:FHA domain-containing protein [Rhodobacter sp.]
MSPMPFDDGTIADLGHADQHPPQQREDINGSAHPGPAQSAQTDCDPMPASDAAATSAPAGPKIWDLLAEERDEEPAPIRDEAQNPKKTDQELAREALKVMKVAIPEPIAPAPNAGRAKTRLLGFNREVVQELDVFDQSDAQASARPEQFPVGWLVIIEGPGRGASFTLHDGVAKIGRGEDQAIRLDFGDTSISRDNHAAIAYDEEQNAFFLGHGGKANLVRLNGRPVLSTEELSNADLIRIGETKLRFVAFCSHDFAWDLTDEDESDGV